MIPPRVCSNLQYIHNTNKEACYQAVKKYCNYNPHCIFILNTVNIYQDKGKVRLISFPFS